MSEPRNQPRISAPRAIAFFFLLAAASRAAAQQIAFDRPEAWALKYFAAVTTFTPLQAPRERAPGTVEIGLEGGWVPYLTDTKRTVGFEGTKVEDLNKTPLVGRPRLLVGLPAGFSVEVGWIPPIVIHGAKANLFDGAIEKAFVDEPRGSFGMRLSGQFGHAYGDYTCPADVVGFPPGSPENPYGCDARSTDVANLNTAGAALTGGFKVGKGVAIHLAGGATYNDLQFQVGAYWNGTADNTLLKTHGWTGWGAAGVDVALGAGATFSAEAFYSPLTVVRPPSTSSQNDGLFNVRGLVRFHLR
ncbi:MAG: hypothetical protein ACM369_13505 [Acidobacteriota bacterium]